MVSYFVPIFVVLLKTLQEQEQLLIRPGRILIGYSRVIGVLELDKIYGFVFLIISVVLITGWTNIKEDIILFATIGKSLSVVVSEARAVYRARSTVYGFLWLFSYVFNGLRGQISCRRAIRGRFSTIGMFVLEICCEILSFLVIDVSTDLEIELFPLMGRSFFISFEKSVFGTNKGFARLVFDVGCWLEGLQSTRCVCYYTEMASERRANARGPCVGVNLGSC